MHIAVGAVALVAFWVAALARKGGPAHRTAGKLYLLTLIFVTVSTWPMIALSIIEGRTAQVVLLSYLNLVTVTAAWLSWRSIRDKRDFEHFNGLIFRGLGAAMTFLGFVILYLSTTTSSTARSLLTKFRVSSFWSLVSGFAR